MKEITIYYDDTRLSCQTFAELFSKYENVQCKKASDFVDQNMIFTNREKVGFVFESQNGKVPYAVSHIMWKLVGDKTQPYMLCVTGGSREFNAVKTAHTDLKQRGYNVQYIYTKYVLVEKYKMGAEDAVKRMMSDMESGQGNIPIKENYQDHSKKELRRHLYGELKNYRKYRRIEKRRKKASEHNL